LVLFFLKKIEEQKGDRLLFRRAERCQELNGG